MNVASVLLLIALAAPPDDPDWIELAGANGLAAWQGPTGDWADVADARTDPDNEKRLVSDPGKGVLVNGRLGRTTNLVSKEKFGDVDVYIEFKIPKGSNAGIKLEGLYEVQILDSYGKKELKAMDCGGIYPRAELLPNYRYLDDGYPPKVNACKPPGEWQTMYITFLAPRFDEAGKKVEDAQFKRVVLNGQAVQVDLPVHTPTGHAWTKKEVPTGPILLQADHGPVAFRSVKVKRITPEGAKK